MCPYRDAHCLWHKSTTTITRHQVQTTKYIFDRKVLFRGSTSCSIYQRRCMYLICVPENRRKESNLREPWLYTKNHTSMITSTHKVEVWFYCRILVKAIFSLHHLLFYICPYKFECRHRATNIKCLQTAPFRHEICCVITVTVWHFYFPLRGLRSCQNWYWTGPAGVVEKGTKNRAI